MPRWFDDAAHSDPCAKRSLVADRPTPLGRAAAACIAIYCIGAVVGWSIIAALVAMATR